MICPLRERHVPRAGAPVSLVLLAAAGVGLYAQPLQHPSIDGVGDFTHVDATVASGGDAWPVERAAAEARGMALSDPVLEACVLAYAEVRAR